MIPLKKGYVDLAMSEKVSDLTDRARQSAAGKTHATLHPRALGKYLAGCVAFSAGAYLFIVSNMGTDPLDTFALGLQRHIPITVGLAQLGVAILCVAYVSLANRSLPMISPLVTFFLCGSIIDLERWADIGR